MTNRTILTALRAAAIVIVATGLNDVITAGAPRYESLYAYCAAVALVVLLDGIVFGVLTAIVATGLYALLFMAREDALSLSVLTPAAAMIGAAVVAAVIRAIAQAQRRRQRPIFDAPQYSPLLEASPLVSPESE